MVNACFEKEQYVVYGKMGVCRVVDRQRLSFGGAEKTEYYILAPLRDERSSVYVPCDNEMLMARLRPLLTRDEIDSILSSVSDEAVAWIEDRGERATRFRAIVSKGDRRQIVRLVRCLYEKKQERLQNGKNLSAADEATLQDCVRLVEEEFVLALGITPAEVSDYIRERMGE